MSIAEQIASNQERILRYQDLIYKWQLQHHDNIKKILQCMLQKAPAAKPAVTEQENLFPIEDGEVKNTLCFGEKLLCYQYQPHDPSLQNLIKTMSQEEFHTLADDEISIILSVILLWLQSKDYENLQIATVCLYEIMKKFPAVLGTFAAKHFRVLSKQLGQLPSLPGGLDDEEMQELFEFFQQLDMVQGTMQ